MITREQAIELFDNNKRDKLIDKIEEYIDRKIENGLLHGNRKIYISTGKPDNTLRRAVKTEFHQLWCNSEISRKSLLHVRKTIIEKYLSNGFEIKEKFFDEGWSTSFDGLTIEVPNEWFLKDKDNDQ